MQPRWLVGPIVLVCALPLGAQNAAVDVLHYRIEMSLPAVGNEIAAMTELTVRPRATPLRELALDFGGLTIDEVTVDGEPASHERNGNRLTIAIGERPGVFRARIRYHGTPADGLFLKTNKYGDPSVFADNWPNRAHHWFPSVDHPSDKASVEFVITAPDRFDVIANGTRMETTSLQNGTKRTHWSEATPIPVHCMVFGATEFSIVRVGEASATEVSYYLYPRDREHGMRELGRVPQILALYSELVGPYPYDKLALVESSTRFGGMENASAIFLDEKRIDGEGTLEGLAAHEIAHQWFGDSVSQRDWHELWLSEGFATYFGHLFFERAAGREAFLQRMRDDLREYVAAQREGARPIYDPSITDLFKLLNKQNYEKGAWVLHMLRGIMGDAPFFAAIREYYAAHRNGNASTDELRVIMERHAGQRLDWFFRQWIREAGHPVFATTWTWRDGKTRIDVEQKQAGMVFRIPAVIELRGATGSRQSVLIDERRELFEIPSESRPAEVVLDPDEWVLKETIPAQ